jgi:hypothetical protein
MNTGPNLCILGFTPRASSVPTITTVLMLALASLAHSATNTVTSLADSGAGSLRQAIADSAVGDTIVFGLTGTVTLTSGELTDFVGRNVPMERTDETNLMVTLR